MEDQPSFAELKEKFSKMKLTPPTKSRSSSINSDPALDTSTSEKPKTESASQLSNCTIATMIKIPVLSSTDAASSTTTSLPVPKSNVASASLAAIINGSQQQVGTSKTASRKPPTPLPRSAKPLLKDETTSESLPVSRNLSSEQTTSARRKPPVPLPRPINQKQDENTSSESSSDHPASSNVNPVTASRKSPVPLPDLTKQQHDESATEESSSVPQHLSSSQIVPPEIEITPDPDSPSMPRSESNDQQQNENTPFQASSIQQHLSTNHTDASNVDRKTVSENLSTSVSPVSPETSARPGEEAYSELNNDFSDDSFTEDEIDEDTYYEGLNQIATQSFNAMYDEQTKLDDFGAETVSLNNLLPSKCMFYEFETIINDYQRRNPRTILCRTIKPTMPKITINEINILQRYSTT